jgi:thiamine biosynthesis lipoprotein
MTHFAGLILAACCGVADDPKLERHTFAEPHMGTRIQITVYAADEATARRAARAAFDRVAALDGIMSDYRPTSELMRLCQQAGGEPVRVSEDLFQVLSRSQDLSRRSGGAFEVTVGPVVRLWRAARKDRKLPEAGELARARELGGFDKVKLDPKARTVQLTRAGMQLDLGGIAKGYAADAAQAVLKKHGITRALVAAGGDIVVSGPPPGREGWSVGIAPLERPGKPARSLVLRDAAVSTSGDIEQFVEIDGKRYSHIVDPKTGLGLVGRSSVTVLAPCGTASDGLATAVSVLGPERGLKLIEETEGAAAYIVRKMDRGEETFTSKRFPKANHRDTEGTEKKANP